MKTIYIMRHPQKDESSSSDDFFINLSSKGKNDAHSIAKKLLDKNIKIDLIVSSPSLRAETTSMILANDLNIEKSIAYNEVLYQGYLEELIESINFTFHTVDTLLLIGHSLLLTNFANHFVGYKHGIKNAEVLHVDFDISSWIDIEPQNAKLIEIIEP